MTAKNNIPAGYKDSAVGIIPQEWELKFFKDVCTFLNGRAYKQEELLSQGKYPVLRVGNFFTNTNWYYSDLELDKDKYAVEGDLLYAWSASFGPRFWNGEKVIYHYHIWKVVISSIIDKLFLYDYLEMDARKLYNQIQGGTMAHITKGDMEQRYIPVPPMGEQRKIAEILGVWDEAIEKQSRLIERLEVRKRALMQRLLTGRVRLSGFTTPWQKIKLGEIGTTYNGLTGKSKDDFESGNAKFVPYINVFSNEKIDINNLGCVKVDSGENQNKVKFGDIFFTVSSETPDEVGMASVLLEDVGNTYLNSFCFGYRLNDFEVLNPVFASYILRGDKFRKSIITLAQGSTRFNISKSEVMKLRIELPSLPEQKAIAEALTAADNEIATHRKKLAALRQQKRGLMQQLLTGKTRVKI